MCDYYNIEIKLKPEIFGMKPAFFWCITKNKNDNASNCGHGWSQSVEEAAKEAYQYYVENYKNTSLK